MALMVQLRDVIPQHMLEEHHEHIQDFLLQEGIRPDEQDLGATLMSERQVKELLEELASNIDE